MNLKSRRHLPKRPRNPKFITIEGGEGSGKSTLIQHLKERLSAKGIPLLITREPGGSPLGKSIRHLLLNHEPDIKIGAMAELLLFLADRAQHIEEQIRPALEKGFTVICDRFNDSTLAYQGIARKLKLNEVETLCNMVCGTTLPDLTLLLDIDPRVGLERAKTSRKDMDRMEKETLLFHDKVRKAFRSLAKKYPERIVLIDASLPPDQVLACALEAIHDL